MSKKDAEVIKAVRKVTATAGDKVPEIYAQEFETALKKSMNRYDMIEVLKKKAEALLKKLKMLNQREPDVKKAMELVSELTQISGSSAGSPGSSASSSHAQKIKGKTSASTKAGTQPSASKPINGVQGKNIAASPAPRSTSYPKGGDHGKVLNRFVSELNLILSLEKDWFTDKTITDCSAVDKKDLEDLQKYIMRLKESKSELLRKEGNNFSKKLVALSEAILKESYASPKNSVTVENDPDEKTFTVIETELAARHKTMLEIEKDIKNLEQKLSFDNKPSTKREKDLGVLKRIQENVATLDTLVNHRLHAVQQTNDHQIEAIDKQLRQLACQVSGKKIKENEQKPTLDSIQQTVQALEGLLKKPAQPVDNNLEGSTHEQNKREYERKISNMRAEAEQLRAEKNDLLTRLSNIAGAKLADDKPNIADLSDQNRPTKLAEKYRETYDTEWTDAYEVLEMEFKYQEKDACTALVRILMDVYDRCNDIAKTQESGLRWYLLNPLANPNDLSQDLKGEDEKDIRSKMIDFRRHTADISIKNIKKGFPKHDELLRNETICKYIDKCIEIFWYMGLQTPPVVLERPPTGNVKFDKEKYSEYTKKGTHLDFVILPPMLLQEDGALLCKGIAQGK